MTPPKLPPPLTPAGEKPTDPKSQEILDSVKAIFADKGFDGASMQDLAQAAGMSAGNFYRYFSSKDAIIEAIVERELAMIQAQFLAIISSPDPRAALLETFGWRIATVRETDGRLWAEIEAGAQRRPEIGVLHDRMERQILASLLGVFARIADISEAEAEARFGAHATLLILLIHGVATGGCSRIDTAGPALHALMLKTVDGILAEVAAGQTAPNADLG